jgi:hypothetical protein
MDINTGAQHDLRYRATRFNEKRCLPACGGDALRPVQTLRRCTPTPPPPSAPPAPANDLCPGVPAGSCVVLRGVRVIF